VLLSRDAIEERDAEMDLHANLEKGDLRLIGVMTVGLEVPGTTGCPNDFMKTLGVRAISWTSDHAKSNEEGRLNKIAWRYAEVYNTALIAYLATNGEGNTRSSAQACPAH
jgi:hypothetical protein